MKLREEIVTPDMIKMVSDDELIKVWGNANFGETNKRKILSENLRRLACDYIVGSTIRAILAELKLVNKPSVPTKKGRRYLRECLVAMRQSFEQRERETAMEFSEWAARKYFALVDSRDSVTWRGHITSSGNKTTSELFTEFLAYQSNQLNKEG